MSASPEWLLVSGWRPRLKKAVDGHVAMVPLPCQLGSQIKTQKARKACWQITRLRLKQLVGRACTGITEADLPLPPALATSLCSPPVPASRGARATDKGFPSASGQHIGASPQKTFLVPEETAISKGFSQVVHRPVFMSSPAPLPPHRMITDKPDVTCSGESPEMRKRRCGRLESEHPHLFWGR